MWVLEATGEVEGLDYASSFEIPVFETADVHLSGYTFLPSRSIVERLYSNTIERAQEHFLTLFRALQLARHVAPSVALPRRPRLLRVPWRDMPCSLSPASFDIRDRLDHTVSAREQQGVNSTQTRHNPPDVRYGNAKVVFL